MKNILLLLLVLCFSAVQAQIPTYASCETPSKIQICKGSEGQIFPNIAQSDNVPDAPVNKDNSCMLDAPNPAWYYIEIAKAGNLIFSIEQSKTPGGSPDLDVDFALWGHLSDASNTCAALPNGNCTDDHQCAGTLIDCSFDDQAVETATINNAKVGEIYTFLITNYDGSKGFIKIKQTGGTGAVSISCCPLITTVNSTMCLPNGVIIISFLTPNTNYPISYTDSSGNVQSSTLASSATGEIQIPGLPVGMYTNITVGGAEGCSPESVTIESNAITGIDPTMCLSNGVINISSLTPSTNYPISYTDFSGNTQSISLESNETGEIQISDLPAGTYTNITVGGAEGCSLGSVTLSDPNAIALSSALNTDNQTVCINTLLTPITYTTTEATGAIFTGLPTGVTGVWFADKIAIVGTPTVLTESPMPYVVTLTGGGCNVVTATGTINVVSGMDCTLNTETIYNDENSAYSIYPNPSYNKFYLLGDLNPNSEIYIYNISTGVKVKEVKVDARDRNEIDLSGLSPGMYLVKAITLSKRVVFKKILKI